MNLPLLTHLHILQLEQYELLPSLKWWTTHPLPTTLPSKTKLRLTPKSLLISLLSLLFFILLLLLTVKANYLLAFLVSVIYLFSPMPFLLVALLLILPLQFVYLFFTVVRIRNVLTSYPLLTTVGITGSFGKTSTKNYLFHFLDSYKLTLTTPHSYNTPFSLAHVIDWELTKKVNYFIAEFSAFRPGNIRLLSTMVPPQFSLITGIGPQHLERFGNLERITQAKFELAQATANINNILVNIDNPQIQDYLHTHPSYKSVKTYSISNPQATFYLTNIKHTKSYTSFIFHFQNRSFPFTSPILFTSQLQNLVAALSMAFILKTPSSTLQSALNSLPQIPHRLETVILNQSTIIDNTYSSNLNGFTQIMADLKKFIGSKVLVTPGLVELGIEGQSIHHQLGQQASEVFDTIVLVGSSTRTKTISQAFHSSCPKKPIEWITNPSDYWPKITALSHQFDWILLENDLPENY
jgi:UDP-N-acetylmuramoyl-tripeptide--D-alanyl-D-alanine ligase